MQIRTAVLAAANLLVPSKAFTSPRIRYARAYRSRVSRELGATDTYTPPDSLSWGSSGGGSVVVRNPLFRGAMGTGSSRTSPASPGTCIATQTFQRRFAIPIPSPSPNVKVNPMTAAFAARKLFVDYTWIQGGDLMARVHAPSPKIISAKGTYDADTGMGCERRMMNGLRELIFEVDDIDARNDGSASSFADSDNTASSGGGCYLKFRVQNPGWRRLYPVSFHEAKVEFNSIPIDTATTNVNRDDDTVQRESSLSSTELECVWTVQWIPYGGFSLSNWVVTKLTRLIISDLISKFEARIRDPTFMSLLSTCTNDDDTGETVERLSQQLTEPIETVTTTPKRNCNRPIRILALHGKGGDGPSFKEYLSPLLQSIQEHQQQQQQAQHDNDNDTDKEPSVVLDCLTAPHPGGKWWEQVPPGSRSCDADSYDGYQTYTLQ